MANDTEAIKETLKAYNKALVDSDTKAVMKLYTPDAVVMPQGFQAMVGESAIKTWYDNVFTAIQLTVVFDIEEVVVTSDEYAFARTNSHGTQKDLKSGSTSHEGNSELFIARKVDGKWKLARYCFCTTNPPK